MSDNLKGDYYDIIQSLYFFVLLRRLRSRSCLVWLVVYFAGHSMCHVSRSSETVAKHLATGSKGKSKVAKREAAIPLAVCSDTLLKAFLYASLSYTCQQLFSQKNIQLSSQKANKKALFLLKPSNIV